MVRRILIEEGAAILAHGRDGAGHQTTTFRLRGVTECFHYSNTAPTNGRSILNERSRLRRLVKTIPQQEAVPEPEPPIGLPEAPETPPAPVLAGCLPLPTPPVVSDRIRRSRRAELDRRYVELRDLDALAEETGIARHKLEIALRSHRGQAAPLLERDRMAKRMRETAPPPPPKAPRRIKERVLTPLDERRISVYYEFGTSVKDLASLYGVKETTIRRITRHVSRHPA